MIVIDTYIVSSTDQHFQSPNHMRFGLFYKPTPETPFEQRIKLGCWRGYVTRTEAQQSLNNFQNRMNKGWTPCK
jgi:hypothetical protein